MSKIVLKIEFEIFEIVEKPIVNEVRLSGSGVSTEETYSVVREETGHRFDTDEEAIVFIANEMVGCGSFEIVRVVRRVEDDSNS